MLRKIKKQFPKTLALALPVALTQVGYMTMILVDTFMVGRLGPTAIAGVGVGSAIFWAFTSFFNGVMMGLDPLISQAHGRGDAVACREWLIQGCYLGSLMSLLLTGLLYLVAFHLDWFGLAPDVAITAREFLLNVSWSSFPFLIFVVIRQYLQAVGRVRTPTLIVVFANIANVVFNWLFVFGNLGFAKLGVSGSALSTSLTRVMMCLSIGALFFWYESREGWRVRDAKTAFRREDGIQILKLGVPAGMQLCFEVGVFSFSTVLAGRIGAVAAAAHTIVMNIASFTYMVPFGIAAATAVQVGHAVGKGENETARVAGWAGVCLATLCMLVFGVGILSLGRAISGAFSTNEEVIRLGAQVILWAALFQVADGIQSSGTGALRGAGNTKFAMVANLVGHWFVGLPLGCVLAFWGGYGLVGIWAGLALGLWLVAVLVLWRWARMS